MNVAYGQGAHSLADYAARGAARITFGPMLQRTLYGRLSGTLSALTEDRNPFAG